MKIPTNQSHPERKPGEIFVGYYTDAEFKRLGATTKRKGNFCSEYGSFPVFVSAVELTSEG